MTDPEIRPEVIDLLFKETERPLTAEEQALADTATDAERVLVIETATAVIESRQSAAGR